MNSPTTDADLDEQACDWLVRVMDAEPEPNDPDADREALRTAFYTWVTLSRRHLETFLETVETFQKLGAIDRHHQIDIRELLDSVPDNVRPLRVHSSSVPASTVPARRDFSRISWPWAVACAAAFILLVRLPVVFQRISAAPTYYATRLGERLTVTLPDHSVVYLNTNSRIEVEEFSGRVREVRLLAGEALFNVAHNALHPFQVRVGRTLVQDVGTLFSVYVHEDTTTVSVAEGAVEVAPSQSPFGKSSSPTLLLHEGEGGPEGRMRKNGSPAMATPLVAGDVADFSSFGETLAPIRHVSLQDLKRRLSWTEGTLWFSGETLAEAAAEFNRYHARQIVLVDPGIRDLTFGGMFSTTTPPESFVSLLTTIYPVQILPPDPKSPESKQIRLGWRTDPPATH